MILKKEESIEYVGGGALTASLVNAASTLIKTLYSIGQNLGSTIRRCITRQNC